MTGVGKTILILAGPNGAGKTTFAREFLPAEARCLTFINADLIAAGLSPFQPELVAVQAGRLMLGLIDQYVSRGESFAFETTLAGRSFGKAIPIWQSRGYAVVIYFLTLSSVQQALDRVARRVRQGGHSVPEEVVRRRFLSGRRNFDEIYAPLANKWFLLDNSEPEPKLIASGGRP